MSSEHADAAHIISDGEKQAAKSEIHQAALSGDLQQVVHLVTNRTHFPGYLDSGLATAFSKNHLDIARYLLEQGAGVTDVKTLYSAYQLKSIPVFQMLLDHGWDINLAFLGLTALCVVAPDDALIRWLLARGANPNLGPINQPIRVKFPSSDSGYVLERVAMSSNVELFDHLLQHGARPENSLSLHFAAESGDAEQIPMIARLLELGFDINAADEGMGGFMYGTPLDWALRYDHVENSAKIKYLQERGAISRRENMWEWQSRPENAARSAELRERTIRCLKGSEG